MGHIVHNAHREVILGRIEQQVVKHRLDLRRVGVLGGQAVAPAHHQRAALLMRVGGAHILIERLAQRAVLLTAVQHGDALHRRGDGAEEMGQREGAVEVHLQKAHLLPPGV